jgi:hypothetical protein
VIVARGKNNFALLAAFAKQPPTMSRSVGRAVAAVDNGDFEADKARYRGRALQ